MKKAILITLAALCASASAFAVKMGTQTTLVWTGDSFGNDFDEPLASVNEFGIVFLTDWQEGESGSPFDGRDIIRVVQAWISFAVDYPKVYSSTGAVYADPDAYDWVIATSQFLVEGEPVSVTGTANPDYHDGSVNGFEWDFDITSITHEAAQIPETGATAALAAFALSALFALRRKAGRLRRSAA